MQNKQAITLLFLANIISGLAQGISMVAIPWYFVKVVSRPEVFASAYIVITFLTAYKVTVFTIKYFSYFVLGLVCWGFN